MVLAVALLPHAFGPSAELFVGEIFGRDLLEISLVNPVGEMAIALRVGQLARFDPLFSQIFHEDRFEVIDADGALLRAGAHAPAGVVNVDVAGDTDGRAIPSGSPF